MGIKFLTSQMIPWCFYMTGSPCHHSADDDDGPSAAPAARGKTSSSASTIRLITSDGQVRTYRRPVAAAELAAEFPKHLVCRSDAFCIGQKVPSLAEDEQLQPGHSYFLLPTQFFQSVLSFVTVASSFARAAAATGTDKTALMKAFDVHKTPSGTLQIRVSDEFIEKIRAEKDEGEEAVSEEGNSSQLSRVCSTAALEKDYRQLVRCRDQLWKPKLEPISEARKKRLEAFSSFKRRKNKELQQQQHRKIPTPPPPPPPPPTRPPIMTTKIVKTKGKQKLRNGKEC